MQSFISFSLDFNSILSSLSCKTEIDIFKYPLIFFISLDCGLANAIHLFSKACLFSLYIYWKSNSYIP